MQLIPVNTHAGTPLLAYAFADSSKQDLYVRLYSEADKVLSQFTHVKLSDVRAMHPDHEPLLAQLPVVVSFDTLRKMGDLPIPNYKELAKGADRPLTEIAVTASKKTEKPSSQTASPPANQPSPAVAAPEPVKQTSSVAAPRQNVKATEAVAGQEKKSPVKSEPPAPISNQNTSNSEKPLAKPENKHQTENEVNSIMPKKIQLPATLGRGKPRPVQAVVYDPETKKKDPVLNVSETEALRVAQEAVNGGKRMKVFAPGYTETWEDEVVYFSRRAKERLGG